MGWFDGMGSRGLLGTWTRRRSPDTANVEARANILAAAIEDELLAQQLPPPPVAGWRYQDGEWLRWSELDDEYRRAPVPASLASFERSIGTPREGMTVALVDGVWQEVADGAAPLRQRIDRDPAEQLGGIAPRAVVDHVIDRWQESGGEQRWTQPQPSQPTASSQPDPAVHAAVPPAEPGSPTDHQRPAPEPTMEEQLAAWRRRNAERSR
jgi:hypothetical protein